MDNLRRKKSSRRYKKRRGNQYTTASIVKTVIRHIIVEIGGGRKRNKLEQVNNPPEETVCNDDVDMTVESLAIDNCASFRKLKDFPVDSNELTFSTSTPHHGKKEQTLPIVDLDESNLNNESNLNSKHLEIGSSYQMIDLGILASTYSAIACPDIWIASIHIRVEKGKKTGTFVAT